jgi:hypothetical protein
MNESDRIRLQHMLDAAREALSFIEGRSHGDLVSDRMLVLSLIAEIQIIGEAATKISPECRSPEVGRLIGGFSVAVDPLLNAALRDAGRGPARRPRSGRARREW